MSAFSCAEAEAGEDSSGRMQLLKPGKPNIVVVILESFLSKAMGTLGGIEGVAVNMDSLGAQGVLFTNFYANSFRTDRGIVSILSGYPAQPTNSIMKYPRKSQSLPSISKALAQNGYDLQYIYGGDALNLADLHTYLADHFLLEDHQLHLAMEEWTIRGNMQVADVDLVIVADDIQDSHQHTKRVFALDLQFGNTRFGLFVQLEQRFD